MADGVMRLTGVAMILGILLSLVPEGTGRKLIRLAGSLILIITAFNALTGLAFPDFSGISEDLWEAASEVSAEGQRQARNDMLGRISHTLESYILDKAAALEAEVTAELTLDPEGKPEAAVIRGTFSPLAKERLSQILEEELMIPKEDQQWILGS